MKRGAQGQDSFRAQRRPTNSSLSQCQNHPFCAFTLLEGLNHFPRGFFDPEKRRFQAFAVKGFRAVVETGGIKIACVTTRQNGISFDDAYNAELRVLEARLDGADDAPPGESSSRVLGR